MSDIFYTRLLLWKRKVFSMLFWLLLPLIGTLLFTTIASTIGEDSRVPVGIVLEDHSKITTGIIDSIEASNLTEVYRYTEEQALHKLEKHELDSVFVIHDGFEKAILSGKRNNIISSYRTELSFAYSPVKELIVSLVQEESGRSKAAHFILNMNKEFEGEASWTWDEVIEKSKQIQMNENLINTSFSYSNAKESVEPSSLLSLNTWGIWAVLSLLSTLFLTDWVIREKSLAVTTRFSFIKMTRHSYYFKIILLYLMLFFTFDLISVIFFKFLLDEAYSFISIFVFPTFRVMLCLLAFSLAQFFKKTSTFYGFSFIVTLILAISSGAVLPVLPHNNIIDLFNPLQDFLSGNITVLWNIIGIVAAILVLWRKEFSNA